MQIQLPPPVIVLSIPPRKITTTPRPARSPLDQAGVIRHDSNGPMSSVAQNVGPTSFQVHYGPQSGIYFAGRHPSCTIVGLGRGIPGSPEIKMTVASDIPQVASLVAGNPPYHLFVIDAPYQDAVSCIDLVVQQPEGNGLYCHRRPLISIVDREMEGLLPELARQYAGSHFQFIPAQKYGVDVIDAQLLGQPRY